MYKVLIIEDDETIRENISEIFELAEYKVYSAPGGYLGVKLAENIKPDLIICDIFMPDINGYIVKEKLNQNKKTSSIPFIYLTANADIKSMREGMNLGADDYIIKPVQAGEIINIVKKRLERINEFKASPLQEKTAKFSIDEKISLNTGKEHLFVPINNFVVIKVTGDYTEIHTNDGKKILVKKTMKSWETILPEKYFVRVYRNIIININFIEKIEPWFKGSLIAKIKFYPEAIKFSKRYSLKIKKMLKSN